MRCPICTKSVKKTDPFFPFCGDLCQQIDLDNWSQGKYVIPGSPVTPGEEADD